MPPSADPDQERRRQAEERSIRGYGLLFEGPGPFLDAEFGELAQRARDLTGAQDAALNVLVGDAQVTFGASGGAGLVTPRAASLCSRTAWLADPDGVYEVADAREETSLADSGWVTGELAHIRFYASAPLVGREGVPIGALCCFADAPRRLRPEQRHALRRLGDVAVQILEVRRHVREIGG